MVASEPNMKNEPAKGKYMGVMLPKEVVDEFGSECRRQGRLRRAVMAKVLRWFLAEPPMRREEICR